jgi:protein gp37
VALGKWWDEAWTCIVGCNRVSAGCDHCYAKRFAEKMKLTDDYGQVFLHHDRVTKPLTWQRPRIVFPSLCDPFHVAVPVQFTEEMLKVVQKTPQHLYIWLTKRPERIGAALYDEAVCERLLAPGQFLHNLVIGVSAENDSLLQERANILVESWAGRKCLSLEPLLGPVNPSPFLEACDWLVCGGETGPSARPCNPAWALSIRDQCAKANVPFYYKSNGEYVTLRDAQVRLQFSRVQIQNLPETAVRGLNKGSPFLVMLRVGMQRAGRLLDGLEHNAALKPGAE